MAGTFSGDIFIKEIFIYFVFVVAVARVVAPRDSSIVFYSDGVHLFANSTGQKSFNGIFQSLRSVAKSSQFSLLP